MAYYALQVKTRGEELYIKMFRELFPEIKFPMLFPQRSLDIRRGGRIKPSKLAIFPGYIFLELPDDESIYDYQWAYRKTKGFFRFLRSNTDIAPLQNRDLELVMHFIRQVGSMSGKSKVFFDDNARIVVISGPLSGLEGRIIKADKRKGRAKVKLDLYDESFSIDLAFEVLVKGREIGIE